jgi:hypothetical protein
MISLVTLLMRKRIDYPDNLHYIEIPSIYYTLSRPIGLEGILFFLGLWLSLEIILGHFLHFFTFLFMPMKSLVFCL